MRYELNNGIASIINDDDMIITEQAAWPDGTPWDGIEDVAIWAEPIIKRIDGDNTAIRMIGPNKPEPAEKPYVERLKEELAYIETHKNEPLNLPSNYHVEFLQQQIAELSENNA